MADAKRREDWDRTADLITTFRNTMIAGSALRREDVHPMRPLPRPQPPKVNSDATWELLLSTIERANGK